MNIIWTEEGPVVVEENSNLLWVEEGAVFLEEGPYGDAPPDPEPEPQPQQRARRIFIIG